MEIEAHMVRIIIIFFYTANPVQGPGDQGTWGTKQGTS